MNKFISMMVTLAVALFAVNSFAWDPPASPAPASWISDTSGVLSPAAHQRLDAKLKVINQSSANEVAALIVPTLSGEDIADVTNAIFKSWGVGKKDLDNGVLVVLAMKEHKMRIETGKGVEGDLPDLKTQDIQVSVMRPRMKAGDVEGALGAGFDAIASSIANHKAEAAAASQRGNAGSVPVTSTNSKPTSTACAVGAVGAGGSDSSGVLLIVALLALVAVVAFAGNRRRQRIQAEEEATRARLAREQAQRRRVAEDARLKREREEAMSKPTPFVEVPVVPRSRPVAPPLREKARATAPVASTSMGTVVVTSAALAAAVAASEAEARKARVERENERRAEDDRKRRERDEEDRRRRERDEEDARRRRRDEESSSSSSSSSSSYDSGSSWGGGSDSGGSGGFGGGDSGGGGSSSDW